MNLRKKIQFFKNKLFFNFYDIVRQQTGQQSSNVLLSSPIKKINNITLQNPEGKLTSKIPSENHTIQKTQYQKFMQQDKIESFYFQDCLFQIISTDYQKIPLKNIYKIIQQAKPQAIFMQVRPDQIIQNFQHNAIYKDRFSDRLYFESIQKRGFELMPSQEHRQKVKFELKENKILYKEINIEDNNFKKEYSQGIAQKWKSYDLQERINLDSISAASFYCERNDLPIIMGDLPEIIYRQNIANSFTLMQLQNIFTKCSREISIYPDIQPQTPMNMAFYLYPEVFLNYSDKYMSTLLHYIKGKHKNILAFVGQGQAESISELMEFRTVSRIQDELKIVPVDLMNNIEELIEKHAIIDVMYYGKNVMRDLQEKKFGTTFKIIERYSDFNHIDKNKAKKMKVLHFKLLEKYALFCQQAYDEGQEKLKEKFIGQIIQ